MGVDLRKWGEDHISLSLKQIDPNTWLVGPFILRRSTSSSNTPSWVDDDHSSYAFEAAISPLPHTSPVDSPHVKLVYECCDGSAVWSIGNNAMCKVCYIMEGITPESVTLNFVRERQPSFQTPQVFKHIFHGDRSFLFLRRLPGRTLSTAWPTLSEDWREHYVKAIASACHEMAQWKSPWLGGVDNQNIPECYLQWEGSEDLSSDQLQARCEAIGMDCSKFHFYHADLGPGNIIVENQPKTGGIGIIDFEVAGYLPKGWIRTKFRISSGLNIPDLATPKERMWWRARVSQVLEVYGFEDYTNGWLETEEMTGA